MLIVGLTGGMACGKSFVARSFARAWLPYSSKPTNWATRCSARRRGYAHVVAASALRFSTRRRHRPRRAWRRASSAIPRSLKRLNAIVHPAVRDARHAAASPRSARGSARHRRLCRRDPDRIRRLQGMSIRSSWSPARVSSRSERAAANRPGATQAGVAGAPGPPDAAGEKEAHFADYVIDTSGTKEETLRQTKMVYRDY